MRITDAERVAFIETQHLDVLWFPQSKVWMVDGVEAATWRKAVDLAIVQSQSSPDNQ